MGETLEDRSKRKSSTTDPSYIPPVDACKMPRMDVIHYREDNHSSKLKTWILVRSRYCGSLISYFASGPALGRLHSVSSSSPPPLRRQRRFLSHHGHHGPRITWL